MKKAILIYKSFFLFFLKQLFILFLISLISLIYLRLRGFEFKFSLFAELFFVSNKSYIPFSYEFCLSAAYNTFILLCGPVFLSLLGALIFTAGMVLFKNRKSSVLLKVIISMGKYSVFIPLILPALFIFYLTFNVTSFFQDFLNIKLYIPLGGMHSVNYSDLNFIAKAADLMRHLILPGAITGLFHFFIFSDYFYKIFDEINKSMFVLAARARGYSSGLLFLKVILPESLFYIGEALKTSVPIVLNSIIVIEIIFSWPGLGRQIYRALLSDNHLGIAKTLMAWAWISIILKAGIYFFIVFVKFTNFNLQIKGNREQCI